MATGVHFEEVGCGLYLLRVPFSGSWAGVYLVRRGDRVYLLDSGASAAGVDDCLVPALGALGLGVGDVTALLHTHTHGDHVGGNYRLRELGLRRCVSYAGSVVKLRDPLRYSKLIRAAFPAHSPAPPAVLRGIDVDAVMQDGESLDGLRLLHSPGHDSDTVCYLDEASGTLLTGDSLQGNGTILQGSALYMDLPSYVRSIERLQAEKIQRVVMGHAYLPWDEPVIAGAAKVRAFLAANLAIVAANGRRIAAWYSEGVRDLPELSRRLIASCDGRPPEYLFLTMYTVREHLRAMGVMPAC